MAKLIEVTIFGRKMQTKEGNRTFWRFWTTLPGDEEPVKVKFRQDCGQPDGDKLPVCILLGKGDCNLKRGHYRTADGEERVERTLWISNWTESGNVYVDHSMDDYFGEEDEE